MSMATVENLPSATQAISTGRAGAVSAHVRPKVHVTLWRSVADELDAASGR